MSNAPEFTPEAPALPLLDELDELRAKATPGPWEVEEDWIWAGISGGGAFGELVTRAADMEDADAALIVAAVNAVPKLTAALRLCAGWADQLDVEADLIDRIGHQVDVVAAKRDAAAGIRSAITTALEAS